MIQLPVSPELVHPSDPSLDTMPLSHTPTIPLRLMYESALTLGAHPDAWLSVHASLDPYITNDAASNMLRDILRQSQDRPHPTAYPRFNAHQGDLETCS